MTKSVLLIGGSSHAGKSTLAQGVAARLGWDCQSTDSLARHPGRPWNHTTGVVKPHVVEHYATLQPEALLADVLAHYERNVLPLVGTIIRERLQSPAQPGLVLEGSALWPDFADRLLLDPRVAAIWLTADDAVFTHRLHAESRRGEATADGGALIDKFLARTLLYNQRMLVSCHQRNLPIFKTGAQFAPDTLLVSCLSLLE
ncbi:MAG: 2-phosphoglycerate kinase [Opitutaceae bacterium]|nr:hypothetical protein [Cephaloticoccus sp.]MCP5529265.1 2-phosphoglycerate kinase [Opitutaceae bacterium]